MELQFGNNAFELFNLFEGDSLSESFNPFEACGKFPFVIPIGIMMQEEFNSGLGSKSIS